MSNLGDRLRALRESKGLKQDELADVLSLSRPSISNIETRNAASSEVIQKLCKHFKVSKEWLVNGEGPAPTGVVVKVKETSISPWRDEAYEVLKKENNRLWMLIEKMSGAPAGSFSKPLAKVRDSKTIRMYPTGAQVGGYAAHA